ncbi:MAG TPA: TolC family protein, partial [Cyclobacteriaceae bacterium]|nr:TolC family protein [Cyclobacteriaceae bacterium]
MKFFYKSFVLVGCVWALPSQAQPQQPQSFSLQQCIEYAIENNPNLKNSKSSIESSQARVRETLASGLPQIGASADLGNNFIIPTTFLPAQVFGGPAGEYVGVK